MTDKPLPAAPSTPDPNHWDHHCDAYGEVAEPDSKSIPGESLMKSFFGFGFRHSLNDFPMGWQMAGVATVPAETRG